VALVDLALQVLAEVVVILVEVVVIITLEVVEVAVLERCLKWLVVWVKHLVH
jgi:hypothetical protein